VVGSQTVSVVIENKKRPYKLVLRQFLWYL